MIPFANPSVAKVFAGYPSEISVRLHRIRELIFQAASDQPRVGRITETLRWGQPSYLTEETGSGSTIRMDSIPSHPRTFAIYFHCQTTLIETFKSRYGRLFRYEGSRALILHADDAIPEQELRECIIAALTYHCSKRGSENPDDGKPSNGSKAAEPGATDNPDGAQ